MRNQRSLQPAEAVEEAVVAVAVVVVEVATTGSRRLLLRLHQTLQLLPPTEVPNTLIFLLEINNGAVCILNGGKIVISVQLHQPALGRMCTPQDQPNEIQTSSVKLQR